MSQAGSLPIDENTLFKRGDNLSEEQRSIIDHYIGSVESDIRAFDEEILDQEDKLASLRDAVARLQRQRSEKDKLLQKLRFTVSAVKRVPLDIWLEVFKWQSSDRGSMISCKPALYGEKQPFNRNSCDTATWDDDDSDEDYEAHYTYTRSDEDRWIARLNWALNMLPATGSAIVGIDLINSDGVEHQVCKLAIQHLYDPLLEASRQLRIAMAVRGSCEQLGAMFSGELAHPENLEHLILRDTGESDNPEFLHDGDYDLVQKFFQTAPNLCRVELVGEVCNTKFLVIEETALLPELPWNQLTHLVMDHQFRDLPNAEVNLTGVLDTLRVCRNLVHLVLLVDAIDLGLEEWVEWADVELPFLKSLIVSFDLQNFFRCLRVPSLSRLEIRNKGYYPLDHISQLIKKSRCSIQNYAEINPSKPLSSNAVGKVASRRETTNKVFDQLLGNLQDVKIFRTLTKLDNGDLQNIASSRFLPQVKVLQFYTDFPLASVIQTLRPRFKSNVNASHHHGLDELIVHYSGRPRAGSLISPHYVDGTSVEMLYEDTVAYRIKINR